MEEEKKILYGDIKSCIDECTDAITTCVWCGIEISVKRFISLEDMILLVNETVNSCFADDSGMYMPEVKDFAFRVGVMTYYTNISLPLESTKECYEAVYAPGLFGMIMERVDDDQTRNIMESISRKLDYLTHSNILEIQRNFDAIKAMTDKSQALFTDIDSEDIRKLISAVGDGSDLSADKIVAAYIDQTGGDSGAAPVLAMA